MIDFLIYHRINALSISDIYSCDDRLFIAVNLLFSIGNFIFVKKYRNEKVFVIHVCNYCFSWCDG